MGEFRYTCSECEGEECGHGGQHEYQPADVVIEVPLSDDKTIYLNAHYEGYGYAVVKLNKNTNYEFYIEEFREYFKDWLVDHDENYRSTKYLCSKIYTVSQKEDASMNNENARYGQTILVDYGCDDGKSKKAVKLTKEILSKCIRADAGMNLPSYLDYLISRTEKTTKQMKEYTEILEKLKSKFSNLEETDEYKNILLSYKDYDLKLMKNFKIYLEGGYVSWKNRETFEDGILWTTDSEKEQIINLTQLIKENKHDEFDKEFKIFEEKYVSKPLTEQNKTTVLKNLTDKVNRQIYDKEYDLNWCKYVIEDLEPKLKEEQERLNPPVIKRRKLRVANQ
jgi:hypothetical protein